MRLRDLLTKLKRKPKGTMSVAIKVTHADGSVTDHGVISETPIEWKTEGR